MRKPDKIPALVDPVVKPLKEGELRALPFGVLSRPETALEFYAETR